MAGEPTQRELSESAGEKLREAAKWLVASFAAVGAALIAGSQLSSIGRLTICADLTLECTRLWWAIGGAVVGLGGVVVAIWTAVKLLSPESLAPSELQQSWSEGNRSAVYRFFTANPSYRQGFTDFADMERQIDDAYDHFDELAEEFDSATVSRQRALEKQLTNIALEIDGLNDRAEAFVSIGNQVAYTDAFKRKALPKLLAAAAVAAVGIGIFAWAGNPPTDSKVASLRGADLSGSDLTGANLRNTDLQETDLSGSDLTGADLTGANLKNSNLTDVTWSSTSCPDGATSDQVGGTCLNHLGS